MSADSVLNGAYDLHVHCSPDVVTRAQDAFDLARAASDAGMAGIGMKDHTTSTVGRCHTLNRMYPDGPRFFSSIALNPPLGGLNVAAAEAALLSGVDIVYLPTYSAAHHIHVLGEQSTPVPHPTDGARPLKMCDEAGHVLREVQRIIELIAGQDAVLATGHVSPAESLAVLRYAQACGVRRLIVTHASQSVPAMSVEDQWRAVELGALIEHCFLAVTDCCPGVIAMESIAEQIRSVGHQHVVLSSDFGQPENGPPVESFGRHARRLHELGFGEQELHVMLRDNPRHLVEDRNGDPS